jgi:transposase
VAFELQEEVAQEFPCCIEAARKALKRNGFTLKKKTKCYKERNEEARLAYMEKIGLIPKETVVHVDETGIDESLCGRIIAPVKYGGTDHGVFEAWFGEALLPKLPEGSTIAMDNVSFHRKKALGELAQKAGCSVLFLPAYSPDYNPIEKTWANMKKFLRGYAFQFDSLQNAISHYFKVELL